MANLLLLGAGFSKNWGAPVASEFFQSLIADPEIREHVGLRNRFWRQRQDFESLLAELQQQYRADPGGVGAPLRIAERAIQRIFDRMSNVFLRQDFEAFQAGLVRDRNRTVVEFLAKFDAIYTLNQDLLLEIHYFDQNHNVTTNRRWGAGASMPGMEPWGRADQRPWSGRAWVPNGNHARNQHAQPFYKLHGSVNWKTADGSDIMIMGGGKAQAIGTFEVLQRYHAQFAQDLSQPGTRLTVVGYGFHDEHVDGLLKAAVENHGLLLFLNDPRGAGLAHDNSKRGPNQVGPLVSEFEAWFERGLYSASTMPLKHLLLDETLDRECLEDFLAGR